MAFPRRRGQPGLLPLVLPRLASPTVEKKNRSERLPLLNCHVFAYISAFAQENSKFYKEVSLSTLTKRVGRPEK